LMGIEQDHMYIKKYKPVIIYFKWLELLWYFSTYLCHVFILFYRCTFYPLIVTARQCLLYLFTFFNILPINRGLMTTFTLYFFIILN
jgi:hypothetical protein